MGGGDVKTEPKAKPMRILNLGAGVQSTTLYLMAVRGEIAIDCAIFADLKEEPAPVYRHLEWMHGLNGPPIHVVSAGRLGDDLKHGRNSTGQRCASIPAWTAWQEGEREGVINRQCTAEYKIDPIEKFIRRELFGLEPGHRFPSDTKVTQLIGISMDEAGRAFRIQANARWWATMEFPLIDKTMTRRDCVAWLKGFGIPHEVPRSACVFCPYKRDSEWVWLRENDPQGFARAIEIDEALRADGVVVNRNMNQKLYIHKSCIPLREVKFTDEEKGQSSFNLECEGGCAL